MNVAAGLPSSGTIYNIDELPGWESCDACAGPGGVGPKTPYSMEQYKSVPSIDGRSAQFWLGGGVPFSAALWWKQLGPRPQASHFAYDLYFYIKTPQVSQALEFDMNQTVNGKKYIFGTECNIALRRWDVWDTLHQGWVGTSLPCNVPPAYTWNHLVEEFYRTPDGKVQFVSITLNGQKMYVNKFFWPLPVDADELNVAFQMDGNAQNTNYIVWLDRVMMSSW